MENQQTAVDWFYDQITRTYWDYMTSEEQNLLFEQAKQMEKEQLKDAWLWGQDDGATICNPNQQEPEEQYYNETYKQQDNDTNPK